MTARLLPVDGGAYDVTPPAQAEAMRDALTKAGPPPEWKFVSGKGHEFYGETNRRDFYENA